MSFEALVDWLDGRLPPDEQDAVGRHAADCAACRADAAWLRRVGTAMRQSEIDPPPELTAAAQLLYRQRKAAAGRKRPRVIRWWPAPVLLASCLLFLALALAPVWSARAEGEVDVGSTVMVRPEGQATWTAATGPLREGDGVQCLTPALVTLFDGSQLRLQSGAEVALARVRRSLLLDHREIVVQQAAGRVVYRVATRPGAWSRFRVQTPTALVTVHGTRFSVEVGQEGDTRVQVEEGAVEIQSVGGAVLLNAAEGALIPARASRPDQAQPCPTAPVSPVTSTPATIGTPLPSAIPLPVSATPSRRATGAHAVPAPAPCPSPSAQPTDRFPEARPTETIGVGTKGTLAPQGSATPRASDLAPPGAPTRDAVGEPGRKGDGPTSDVSNQQPPRS
ncbi:MAG: FecR domain-containing protein [Anaerolineae bacterium]